MALNVFNSQQGVDIPLDQVRKGDIDTKLNVLPPEDDNKEPIKLWRHIFNQLVMFGNIVSESRRFDIGRRL